MNTRDTVGALPIRFVTYRGGLYDTEPSPSETTWSKLVAALSVRRVRPGAKEYVPGWSPIEVHPGMTRSLAAVVSVWALVLDYDGTATLEQAREAWAPWAHVGHTTWGGPPRCRVIVPLATPCLVGQWVGVYNWAKRRDPRIDKKTSDASRFWFQPATEAESSPFVSWTHEGAALELDYARLVAPKPVHKPLAPVSGVGGRRVAVHRLKHPDARRAAADYLRAAVNGNGTAKGALCPACGRPSIWWACDKPTPAVCNHQKSCGWVGPLFKVLDCADARQAA